MVGVWALKSSAVRKGKEQQETKLKLKFHANEAGLVLSDMFC